MNNVTFKSKKESRARKNRFKYKTLRRIGFFKIFVMDYPNSNAREYLKKTAEILGEDIEVDDIFLGESIKMIRQRTDTWSMNEVKEDSPEWAIAMVAFCRYPEIAEQLKTKGHTLTEVQRSTLDEKKLVTTSDIYYLFDTEHDRGLEPFKPVSFFETNWNAQEQLGKSIKRFNDERIVTTRLDWTFPEDK